MRKKHEDKNNPNIISKRMRWNENITCENNKQTFFMKEKIASFLIDFTDSKWAFTEWETEVKKKY